jgi:hypothetical protein
LQRRRLLKFVKISRTYSTKQNFTLTGKPGICFIEMLNIKAKLYANDTRVEQMQTGVYHMLNSKIAATTD